MPRILPRLLEKIEKQANHKKFFNVRKPRDARKSLYKPPPPIPSFHPSAHPKSILLTPQNPIVSVRDYARHKRRPPSLTKPGSLRTNDVDPPRQMSRKELEWWANPYLRMLSSPIRVCSATQRRFPSDFLVRLAGLQIPSSRLSLNKRDNAKLVPDGILHPKYTSRMNPGGLYILCWRKAISQLAKGGYKRVFPQLTLYPQLDRQIAHLLRLRVLQEFELLAERLEFSAKTGKTFAASTILRRLTRDEWGKLRSTGSVPYQNAAAVLILPPVNKRGNSSKERPKGSLSALPPKDEHNIKGLPPMSSLLSSSTQSSQMEPLDILPSAQVPLYNSITAFPCRSQRSALHCILLRILAAERRIKRLYGKKEPRPSSDLPFSLSKGSHAFLLCADGNTLKRGDSTAVAIALWRLRMYDSEDWDTP